MEAYQLYSAPTGELIAAGEGKVIYSSTFDPMIVGDKEELWEIIAIVEYPAKKGFVDLI